MKIKNASITILINKEQATIELHDEDASITFAEIILSPEQLCSALSRLSHTSCKLTVGGLDKIGKKMEHKELIFEITEDLGYGKERYKIAEQLANKACPKGWSSSNYFGSQGSFFVKNGKQFARCTIRRWI